MKLFYDNGQLMGNIPFTNGIISGKAEGFYDNGKILSSVTFKNNRMDGIKTIYYKNGNKQSEKMYKNGIWTGDYYKEYSEDGKLVLQVSKSGLQTIYTKIAEDGTKSTLTAQEKSELLKQIDTREAEKKQLDTYLQGSEPVKKFFRK
jgi:antitoxin component YwqK of YwqJK toxin-antitoxin module